MKNSLSLKSAINTAILLVSILTLVVSVAISTLTYKKNKKDESIYLANTISEIIAYNAAVPISFEQRIALNEFMATLQSVKEVLNVHIYRVDEETKEIEFFTSYNSSDISPVVEQKDRMKTLHTARFSGDFLEYSIPVKHAKLNQVIGYVYIKLSISSYKEGLYELIKINTLIVLVLIVVAFVIAQSLRSRILKPINRFVTELESASKDQTFEKKVSPIEFDEISAVTDAVNELLARIAQQIRRFSLAEQEITELNQNLEEKVVFRTKALKDSNQELLTALEQVHQYQSQVIQSEKMASLGQMVAGVAHEVNTPIGLGVTASTMLSDRIDDISVKLEDKTLSAAQLTTFLNESKENTQIIYRNLNRAADLISSFKQVAVDQTAGIVRTINLHSYLDEIITSMHPTLKKYRHKIVINCDDRISINTKPGPLNQIIINLTMNSILHAFKSMEQGVITITAKEQDGTCTIIFSDNGCGIEQKIKQKVFDPFVTTSRGDGGSGLGLHLVYNLVTQALQGKISVESQLNNGAEFTLEFPTSISGSESG